MKLILENWRKYLDEKQSPEQKLAAIEKEKEAFLQRLKVKLVKSINFDELFKRLEIMPGGKQQHSMRVGGHVAGTGDPDVILGALMHDYVERGGDIDELVRSGLISEPVKDIILFLSSTDEEVAKYAGENEPLDHMIHVFKELDNQDLKNKLVLIKISDRVDNLNRRAGGHKPLSGNYLAKSRNLINFLRTNYKGDIKHVDGILSALHPLAQQGLSGNTNETPT